MSGFYLESFSKQQNLVTGVFSQRIHILDTRDTTFNFRKSFASCFYLPLCEGEGLIVSQGTSACLSGVVVGAAI